MYIYIYILCELCDLFTYTHTHILYSHLWENHPATDQINFSISGPQWPETEASSLAGLEDIDDKLEAMEKMTPEEADDALPERWMMDFSEEILR